MDKRQLILESAKNEILEKGFKDTSVSNIVKRANVAQGTFYLYFQSKNDLVEAFAQMILEEQLGVLKRIETKGIENFIDSIIQTTYEITKKHSSLIVFLYSGMAYNQQFETWEKVYKPYYDYIYKELLSLLPKQSEHIMDLTHLIVGLIEHSAEHVYLYHKDDYEDAQRKVLKRFCLNALRGE